MRHVLLVTAIAGALSAVAAPADATALNPRGLGQVLLYPYYTVEGDNQTVLTVVNTTNRVKAVRVRLHEGRNAKPVLDFNLYLSPFDVWTSAVYGGTTGAAQLLTTDTSCTVGLGTLPVTLSSAAYTGANQDWLTAGTPAERAAYLGSPERTREGFVEIIEMGVLQNGPGPTQLAEEATHLNSGVPLNCTALFNAWQPQGAWTANGAANIDPPSGGLYGNGALVDVPNGTMASYAAEALTEFYTNFAQPGALHRAPGNARPSLADADNGNGNAIATVFTDGASGNTAVEVVTLQAGDIDAVSFALMQSSLYNDFYTEPVLDAATEWVLAFPTRAVYAGGNDGAPPFTDGFADDGQACEQPATYWYDREEGEPAFSCGGIPFPGQGECPRDEPVCGSTTVLAVNQVATAGGRTTIFGARFGLTASEFAAPTASVPQRFQSGNVVLEFDDGLVAGEQHVMAIPGTAGSVIGLPVIGFAVQQVINNNAAPGVLANYAGSFRHRGVLQRVTD